MSDSESFAASQTSSSFASRFPYAIFSKTVPSNKNISWLTNPILFLKLSSSKSLIFLPSNLISPEVESYNLKISFIRVDFPEPVLPTIAVVCPLLMSIEISFKTGKFFTYSKFKFDISIFLLKLVSFSFPLSIVGVVFFKFIIRLNDAIAF